MTLTQSTAVMRTGALGLCLGWAGLAVAEPSPAANAAFHNYAGTLEARLDRQHRSPAAFLAPEDTARLRRGEVIIEQLTPADGGGMEGALLHDWRGSAFVPGATAAGFERLLANFESYPRVFAPQVMRAAVLRRQGDEAEVTLRVRQKHVITVVLDTTYDVRFGRLDAQHGFSTSRSTKINEIDGAGTGHEHALAAGEEHGFLWGLNSYWSYAETDGGLYLQIESVSLTRSIPTGLEWVIGPYIKSIPRESLEFTLRAACAALRK